MCTHVRLSYVRAAFLKPYFSIFLVILCDKVVIVSLYHIQKMHLIPFLKFGAKLLLFFELWRVVPMKLWNTHKPYSLMLGVREDVYSHDNAFLKQSYNPCHSIVRYHPSLCGCWFSLRRSQQFQSSFMFCSFAIV